MDAETPKVGDRRPREGRCERCDRPLTDLVARPIEWLSGTGVVWIPDAESADRCAGSGGASWRDAHVLPGECTGAPVDWRARALAAEAEVADLRSRAIPKDADFTLYVTLSHDRFMVTNERVDAPRLTLRTYLMGIAVDKGPFPTLAAALAAAESEPK